MERKNHFSNIIKFKVDKEISLNLDILLSHDINTIFNTIFNSYAN
ncbi:hypothetical protein [Clostridium beijerinckii]|nr:hypothetical protein [Clostridium beijerinckii]